MKSESKKRKGKRWWLRILSLISFTLLLLLFLIIFAGDKKEIIQEPVTARERKGVAVIITGAAARIPQEGALLKELDDRGLLKDLVFISGVSSGALNAIMLNGILSGTITWEDYYELLDSLDNNHIFIRDGKRLPVNTAPARALYKSVFEDKLGYHSIGDLPITTSLSFTHLADFLLPYLLKGK